MRHDNTVLYALPKAVARWRIDSVVRCCREDHRVDHLTLRSLLASLIVVTIS